MFLAVCWCWQNSEPGCYRNHSNHDTQTEITVCFHSNMSLKLIIIFWKKCMIQKFSWQQDFCYTHAHFMHIKHLQNTIYWFEFSPTQSLLSTLCLCDSCQYCLQGKIIIIKKLKKGILNIQGNINNTALQYESE